MPPAPLSPEAGSNTPILMVLDVYKRQHVFCAAYRADECAELLQYADHSVFNSPSQLAKFGPAAKAAGKSVGLRLNPECSTQEGHAIYDPCAPGSRLGTTRAQWDAAVQADPRCV